MKQYSSFLKEEFQILPLAESRRLANSPEDEGTNLD